MTIVAIILMALASIIALLDLIGVCLALNRQRRGISGGYSTVVPAAIVLCFLARFFAPDTIGWWAFGPLLVDPGTYSLLYLPIFLVQQACKKS
jgi:hypothetical protein